MRRLLALLLVLLPLTAGTAQAAEPVPFVGSWTQLRLSTPLGELPDLQSTDGEALPVENGPLGVLAISAVRMSASVSSLSLARTDSSAAVSTPAVWACPAKTLWKVGNRQPWAERPQFDCTTHAVGTSRGGVVTWDLRALSSTSVDVVLVPDPSDTSAFAVTFGAPVASSFGAVASPPQEAPTEEPSFPAEVAPVPETSGAAVLPALPQVTVPAAPQAATVPPVAVAAPRAAARDLVPVVHVEGQWRGPALLAFLTLLLMARTALPSRSTKAPVSLLRTTHLRESETC